MSLAHETHHFRSHLADFLTQQHGFLAWRPAVSDARLGEIILETAWGFVSATLPSSPPPTLGLHAVEQRAMAFMQFCKRLQAIDERQRFIFLLTKELIPFLLQFLQGRRLFLAEKPDRFETLQEARGFGFGSLQQTAQPIDLVQTLAREAALLVEFRDEMADAPFAPADLHHIANMRLIGGIEFLFQPPLLERRFGTEKIPIGLNLLRRQGQLPFEPRPRQTQSPVPENRNESQRQHSRDQEAKPEKHYLFDHAACHRLDE